MRCFHCNEPIPPGTDFGLDVGGERRAMCCPGCVAVAELIEARGLERFYEFRSAPARKPETPGALGALGALAAARWNVCDRPEVAARLTRTLADGTRELQCQIDGINCAACAWLVDRGLRGVDGIDEISVNPVTRAATIRYDGAKLAPSTILAHIASFGFEPRPGVAGFASAQTDSSRSELKRLAVAGLGFAQVMTLSAALYLGAFKSMTADFESFLVLASLLVATPVVLYAGAPIFRAAWAAVARRRLGMDVPVSLAIGLALGASIVNAYRGSGHVYFDSATMFVFFLTLGRFLESRARHKAGSLFGALGELVPIAASRRRGGAPGDTIAPSDGIEPGDGIERVGTIELRVGDVVVVAPGEAVPADGALVSAHGTFDESLLSGESLGRLRERGDAILGGSLNVGHAPVEIRVTRIGADSYIERVGSMLQKAIADRPASLALADRWARWFIAAILVLTVVTGSVWLVVAPERAFETVLAMLVVTCPCALSLAAPTAFAVALGTLARRGLLLRSARALERLGDVELWLFDKTGTLTEGRIGVADIDTHGALEADACLELAAALEAGIEHPIARALQRDGAAPAEDVELVPGYGVGGTIAGVRYRLGSARFVGLAAHARARDDEREHSGERRRSGESALGDEGDSERGHAIYLGFDRADDRASERTAARDSDSNSDCALLATIELDDMLRPHARDALETLRAHGAEIMLVSGDAPAAVTATAQRLGIDTFFANHDPAAKLTLLQAQQAQGDVVAAVGDGINDAPLLGRADVSVAMIQGSRLAQASSDVVFTGDDLRVLARLPDWARTTRRIVRENLSWAALYNLAAVPLAATGVLAPWMAALGMSLSSLIVVGNALRLHGLLGDAPRAREHRGARAGAAHGRDHAMNART